MTDENKGDPVMLRANRAAAYFLWRAHWVVVWIVLTAAFLSWQDVPLDLWVTAFWFSAGITGMCIVAAQFIGGMVKAWRGEE